MFSVQRECKINGDDHKKQIPTCQVNFEPMDVRQRMYFSVSTIEAKNQDLQPGIPMYLPRLQETVAEQMFDTKKVSVTFDTPDGILALFLRTLTVLTQNHRSS